MISNVDLFFRNSSHKATRTGPYVSHLKLCDKLHVTKYLSLTQLLPGFLNFVEFSKILQLVKICQID